MAESVIDELIVRLTMDTKQYDKADKAKNARIDETEAKEKQADRTRERRKKSREKESREEKREDDARRKRLGQTEKAVKSLGSTLKAFTLTAAAVFGLGAGVGGIVHAITNLAGFETGLRRAAVSTGMSNRQMQAWGATAKRMGADADAGADAIAALAREQKQFNITGQGPTMMALARMGVAVSPGAKPEDMLEQAQQIYRRSSPAQQQQMESALAAQGVSNDLIVMIKSEIDAREAYQRSLADSIEENKQSMHALNDALTTLQQASLKLANVIAIAATPYIQQFSDWVHNLASDPHKVDAFLHSTADALQVLGKMAIDLAHVMKDAWTVVNAIAHPVANAANNVQAWLHKPASAYSSPSAPGLFVRRMLHDTLHIGSNPDLNVDDAHGGDFLKDPNAPWSAPATAPTPAVAAPSAAVSTQDFMQQLVQRGLSPAQAIAATANAEREAPGPTPGTINPAAVNPNGGASGVFQWLGDRKTAFRAQYGVDPDQAPLSAQLDFAFGNASEVARMQKALAGDQSAQALGRRFSEIYEAHGNVAEDVRRGQLAAQLAAQTGDNGTASTGTSDDGTHIHINGPVTVKANDPESFIGGIKRIAMVQNYQTAVR